MSFYKITTSITVIATTLALAIPANANWLTELREGITLYKSSSPTSATKVLVKPDVSVSKAGYMVGAKIEGRHVTEVGDGLLGTSVSLSFSKGSVEINASEWGKKGSVTYLGRNISEKERILLDAQTNYTLSDTAVAYMNTGIAVHKLQVTENMEFLGAVESGSAESWSPTAYAEVGLKKALPEQNALLTTSLRVDSPIDYCEIDYALVTMNDSCRSYLKTTAKFDYMRATDWGMYGGHIAAVHEADWYPEVGLRAQYNFENINFGSVDIRPTAFAVTVVDWEDGRNEKATIGLSANLKNGLSASVGARFDSRRENELFVDFGVRF